MAASAQVSTLLMAWATIQFFDDLNDFLSPKRRGRKINFSFKGNPAVKHIIESMGVPHPEVDQILVDGEYAGFEHGVFEGEVIDVYPINRSQKIEIRPGFQKKWDVEPRFILDNHLGKLAIYLRMLGMDALYRNDFQDKVLAALAFQGERVLLTRDRQLLMRKIVRDGYWVRNLDPRLQLIEVMKRFNLCEFIIPFKRCIKCNCKLIVVPKESVLDRLRPLTRQYYNDFRICLKCDQIYWKGSHYARMKDFIEEAIKEAV